MGNSPHSVSLDVAPKFHHVIPVFLTERVAHPHAFAQSENSLLPPQTPPPHVSGCLCQELSGDSQSGAQGLASVREGSTSIGTNLLAHLGKLPA